MVQTCTVITAGDLERMRALATGGEESTSLKKDGLVRRKELSTIRAARWPDTLQASRARKEQAVQDRAAAEEAAKVEADRVSTQERAAARQLALQRANKMLHDASDKVKTLHGSLLLSEVMAQNAALIAQRGRVAELQAQERAAFAEQQRQALEAAEQVELDKLAHERVKLLAQRDVQVQQLEELKARILAERAADKAEGELVKRKAAEEATELKEKEAAWRAKMQAMNDATAAANATLQAFRAAERERERLVDAAVEDYCKRKAATDAERAAALAAKQAAKEARRRAQVELMERNYAMWHTKTEEALAADTRRADLQAAQEAEARRARREKQRADAHSSNQQQLERKAAEARAQAKADRAFREAWGTRLQELRADERREVEEARARAVDLRRFWDWQVAERWAARTAVATDSVQTALMAEAAVGDVDAELKEYAEAVVAEAQRRGLPLEPIRRCLATKESPIKASL